MDCKAASELIMKYLDKEITLLEEELLYKHIDSCEGCKLEFEILKDACLLIEDTEFEEPPEDFESKVILRIKQEDAAEATGKRLRLGITAFIIIMIAWIALPYVFVHTPVVRMVSDSFNYFLYLAGSLMDIVSRVWGIILSGAVRLFTVVRAFKVVERAIIDMYSVVIISMILLMAVVLQLYGYMFKIIRR